MSTTPPRIALALGALALAGTGCFNDAFRGPEFSDLPGTDRFELVIEADRTLVDGSHFLMDRATGDLWRLDVSGRAKGTWVRLASGPADAAELAPLPGLEKDEQDD